MSGAEGGPSSGTDTMGPQWDREARSYSPGKERNVSAELIKILLFFFLFKFVIIYIYPLVCSGYTLTKLGFIKKLDDTAR